MTLSQSIQISLCFSITVVYDAKVGKKNEKNFDPSQIPPSPLRRLSVDCDIPRYEAMYPVPLSRYHIPQCHDRMVQNHPWSAIAHYFTNLISHFRPVTMHSTFMAFGLLLTELAMLKSCK